MCKDLIIGRTTPKHYRRRADQNIWHKVQTLYTFINLYLIQLISLSNVTCVCLEGKGLKNLNFKSCKPWYLFICGRLCDIIAAKIMYYWYTQFGFVGQRNIWHLKIFNQFVVNNQSSTLSGINKTNKVRENVLVGWNWIHFTIVRYKILGRETTINCLLVLPHWFQGDG